MEQEEAEGKWIDFRKALCPMGSPESEREGGYRGSFCRSMRSHWVGYEGREWGAESKAKN